MLTAIDPSTGKVIREVEPAGPEKVEEILAAAADAAVGWGRLTFDRRAEVLHAVATYLRQHVDELAPLMTEEMGKPVGEARGEVAKAALCFDHYADHGADYLADEMLPSDASTSYVQHLPLGTVLGVLPWNAPFWLWSRFAAPALMAGNTCVMKHDPHVPGCAAAIADVFTQVGAPDGVFQNLPLETPQVEAVIRDPRVHAVSFTGSARGGAAVASTAAAEIKPTVLELGGSDPCLVLADADLDAAADTVALSRIINAGQSCIAAKRIIVESAVYPQMVDKLRERLARLTVGDPAEESTDVGPIAREDLRETLHRQVTETVDAGARLLLGGELPEGDGWFYPVTMLADVTEGMTACREETFGPVMVVMEAPDAEEALAMANRTEYGLAASVWSTAERGVAMARRIEAGQVAVNGIVKTDPRLPSGGVKRSGYGRELGPHGIREFVNVQQVWVGPRQD
ncbi:MULTISPECIES: NAD-dependent succinate-semialdehyde dehydrogenase [Isoptericola]|uniref:NAD-dependent succinate-semialdehyde dehydrogenase n=1 Tax=Isoptericola sediminis TaxID=2733572 RepID=A0A849K4T7_9MICO|nr:MULTISPECIES: NAD-dependent succinate-semialdehyde dehydrogenase [Isoptericola]MDO8145394.1 NAD-dependent succinate-semialdehyde dehydrogenase [Isoptericola sp. 178]MDO8149035.1 NAD-dependent succinate-semialdehyde dehydrogenase [Isoptericola sp. b515]MDO8151025.1 NAD-dependent succinate-semialdehyde dehydrogenase [Isoptericola sp. b408]NNU28358.1 NAD-dependent succinate-semialdehyde dehydrogenase [Isoptericola sediminis]